MTHKTLLTFGDSWPQGGELTPLHEVPYGDLLQRQMGFDKFFNYGSAGASNEDMLYQFQEYIADHHNTDDEITAVFFLTNPSRSTHWPRFGTWNEQDREWQHWPTDAKEWAREVFMHFHRKGHEVMRSSSTITALQSWSRHYKINDIYFAGWVRYPEWLPGVDTSKIWKQGTETAADWFGATDYNGEHLLNVADNEFIRPNFAHPNQLGHELIASKLEKWITPGK